MDFPTLLLNDEFESKSFGKTLTVILRYCYDLTKCFVDKKHELKGLTIFNARII